MKIGLIGKSLPYTLSPRIHGMFLKGKQYLYDLIELNDINQISKDVIKSYTGLNVTVPYKCDVIKYMDELRGDALELQTVNTIYKDGDKLIGNNTDTYGFKQLLLKNKINPNGKVCVVLGTGGASQAVQCVLRQMNASKIIVVSRHPKNPDFYSYDELCNVKGYLIVNTTPVGTSPNIDRSPVNETVIQNFDVLVDLIYNPSLSKFLSYGIKNKKLVVNGLYMLVSQAIKSEEYWQEIKYSEKIVNDIFDNLKIEFNIANNSNIYLIGMMGCGKSTLGKYLAKSLGYNFIDMDKEIEKRAHMSIPDMFKIGEEYFRNYESETLIDIALNNKRSIVSTGGGVIKSFFNINAMKISGATIWLDRNIDLIKENCDTKSRPLLKGKNQYISTIYNERKMIYDYAKDIKYCNNNSVEEDVKNLSKIIKGIVK